MNKYKIVRRPYVDMLVVVNRWQGRPLPELGEKMHRIWSVKKPPTVQYTPQFHTDMTYEQVHRWALEAAYGNNIPYFAVIDDDAYVNPNGVLRVVEAFDQNPDVGKIVPMNLGTRLKFRGERLVKTLEHWWLGFGGEFYRTKAAIEADCFTDGALMFEDRLASRRLVQKKWWIAQAAGVGVSHVAHMRGGLKKSIELMKQTRDHLLTKYPDDAVLHKLVDRVIREREKRFAQDPTASKYIRKRPGDKARKTKAR